MHQVKTYHVEVRGPVEEKAFNETSPLQITVVPVDAGQPPVATTLASVCTDQSGLIGLMRHLHHQGFVVLSVHRER